MTTLIPRDVEAEARAYLLPILDVPVSTDPVADDDGDLAPPFLRIDLTAAYRRDMISDQFQIAVQGYAANAIDAHRLTAKAFAAMLDAAEAEHLTRVRSAESVSGPVPFNDPDFRTAYRYQATVLWTLRPSPTGD